MQNFFLICSLDQRWNCGAAAQVEYLYILGADEMYVLAGLMFLIIVKQSVIGLIYILMRNY